MSRPQHVIAAVVPKVLTLPEVSKYLNVSSATIYRLLGNEKSLPSGSLVTGVSTSKT